MLTRRPGYQAAGCTVVGSADEALSGAAATGAEEVVVIGGSEVFQQFMPRCEKVYLTIVEGTFEGDAFFPAALLEPRFWEVIHEEHCPADSRNRFDTRYRILVRRDRDGSEDSVTLPPNPRGTGDSRA